MLRFMGESISEEEIKDIIEEADKDKDGLIDYSEFYSMMCCPKNESNTTKHSTSAYNYIFCGIITFCSLSSLFFCFN